MSTQPITHPLADTQRRSARARLLTLLGPVTVTGGVAWALWQPYRVTLLHPRHQGFWWLAVEPPLLVIVAGLVFARLIVRPLLDDLEGDGGTPR